MLQLPKLDLAPGLTAPEDNSNAEHSQMSGATPQACSAEAPSSAAFNQGSDEEKMPRQPAHEQISAPHDAIEPSAAAAEDRAQVAEAQDDAEEHAAPAEGEADALAALKRLNFAQEEEPYQAPKGAADPGTEDPPALNAAQPIDAGLAVATSACGAPAADGYLADSDSPVRRRTSPAQLNQPEAVSTAAIPFEAAAAEAARLGAAEAPAAAAEPQQGEAVEEREENAAGGAQEAVAEKARAAEPPCPPLDMDAVMRAKSGAALAPSPSLHVLASPLRQTSGAESPLLQARSSSTQHAQGWPYEPETPWCMHRSCMGLYGVCRHGLQVCMHPHARHGPTNTPVFVMRRSQSRTPARCPSRRRQQQSMRHLKSRSSKRTLSSSCLLSPFLLITSPWCCLQLLESLPQRRVEGPVQQRMDAIPLQKQLSRSRLCQRATAHGWKLPRRWRSCRRRRSRRRQASRRRSLIWTRRSSPCCGR